MIWEQVEVATSHKQIWARGVASCEGPEGREPEAMRLPSHATARQVMMPVSSCCRHLHHNAVKQGCYQHTDSCMTCSAMHQLMALSSHIDGNMMNMALQHASVSAEVVYHCHYSHHQFSATVLTDPSTTVVIPVSTVCYHFCATTGFISRLSRVLLQY